MNLMHKIQITIFTVLMMAASTLHAGNQGVSAYFGLGLGGSQVTDTDLDIAPTLGFLAGIEEDGWAVEYGVFQSSDTGIDGVTEEFSISGTQTSLSYRTVESGSLYYKVRYGSSDMDVEFTTDPTVTTSGKIWGLALGMRLARDERLEIEYGVYIPSDDTLNNTHMLMFNYLFGGPGSGRR